MTNWLIAAIALLAVLLSVVGLVLFTLTRGALLVRRATGQGDTGAAHVYPIYSNQRLIRLIDWQPLISAILLFQYDRLVSRIVADLGRMDLGGQTVLITSCAFGNVIPRVVDAALAAGAAQVLIVDIIGNELRHARSKLARNKLARHEPDRNADRVRFIEGDAVSMGLPDASVAANIVFFLLHELPHPMKTRALDEATRLLTSGGTVFVAEFHRPSLFLLRVSGWLYFTIFEPLGLAIWDRHDPLRHFQQRAGWACQRSTCLFDNFQIVTARRPVLP